MILMRPPERAKQQRQTSAHTNLNFSNQLYSRSNIKRAHLDWRGRCIGPHQLHSALIDRDRSGYAFFLHFNNSHHATAKRCGNHLSFADSFASCFSQRLIASGSILPQRERNTANVICAGLRGRVDDGAYSRQVRQSNHYAVACFVSRDGWWLTFFIDSLRLQAITARLDFCAWSGSVLECLYHCVGLVGIFPLRVQSALSLRYY